jgi:hypothetical protein
MTQLREVTCPNDGTTLWAGYGDIRMFSPNKKHCVWLPYAGEPPHGDSYHRIQINERSFPGFAWGCQFAFTPDSRYFAFSWMLEKYERKTAVVDVVEHQYFVLPKYIYDFQFVWPHLEGRSEKYEGHEYTFTGAESWLHF